MSENRFTLNKGLYECLDMSNCLLLPILDDGRELSVINVVELLNELHKENGQLRHDASVLIQSNQDYRKENEQLKQLADANEEFGLKLMTFLHDKYYEIWEEVNKCIESDVE